jgi:hypothetical protein
VPSRSSWVDLRDRRTDRVALDVEFGGSSPKTTRTTGECVAFRRFRAAVSRFRPLFPIGFRARA